MDEDALAFFEQSVWSLQRLRDCISERRAPQFIRVVSLKPEESVDMAEYLRVLSGNYDWRIRYANGVFGLARLARELEVVIITLHRLYRNNGDRVATQSLRQRADELLRVARRIGWSVVTPTTQLRNRLVRVADATARGNAFGYPELSASSWAVEALLQEDARLDELPDPVGPPFA